MTIVIKTNNVPRDIIYWNELTEKERKEFDYLEKFDYLDLDSIEFFRYEGNVYYLGDFLITDGFEGTKIAKWDGYRSNSFLSGIVVKYVGDYTDCIIVGTYFS